MKKTPVLLIISLIFASACQLFAQIDPGIQAFLSFDGSLKSDAKTQLQVYKMGGLSYIGGLDEKALSVKEGASLGIRMEAFDFAVDKDFSICFWMKTKMPTDEPIIVLSNKKMPNKSLASQKKKGWAFYLSGGSIAWNIGSGTRRLNYERDNAGKMPVNDGRWHFICMSYKSDCREVRLYQDGKNFAIYKLGTKESFDFENGNPLFLGWNEDIPHPEIVPSIIEGREHLQNLTDLYQELGLPKLSNDDFKQLIIDPQDLIKRKVDAYNQANKQTAKSISFEQLKLKDLLKSRDKLKQNPYTIFQAPTFMKVAPLFKLYSLEENEIQLNREAARSYSKEERVFIPDYAIDNLTIYKRAISAAEVSKEYGKYLKWQKPEVLIKNEIIAGDWNIFHGGKHQNLIQDGEDPRKRVAEVLKSANVDFVMMQETYSSGDFIAAELGFYYATTIDWDYLNQGANISVMSRYPIEEVFVLEEASFMNVAAKIKLDESRYVFVMSNWYGMQQFPNVFDFHKARFNNANQIPVLFAGDFNAVPHTDGGDSPASVQMLKAGFNDAYRLQFPDVKTHPGYSHRSGSRIDQLYFKGKTLKHQSTRIISDWVGGFPSDHYLLVSEFALKN